MVVVCGRPVLEDDHGDTLLNPTVIVEVLSPSTEAYDRGDKFAHYRRLASLREYVIVAQDQPRIERFLRQGEQWLLTEASGLGATVELTSIECRLALADVYERLTFESAAPLGARSSEPLRRGSHDLVVDEHVAKLVLVRSEGAGDPCGP